MFEVVEVFYLLVPGVVLAHQRNPPMENVADLYIACSQKYHTDPKITGNSLLSSGRRPMIASKLNICRVCHSEGRVVVNMRSRSVHQV